MYYDNRVLDINGYGQEGLTLALKMAFLQSGGDKVRSYGWSVDSGFGLFLYPYSISTPPNYNMFMSPATAEQCCPLVFDWIQDNAEVIKPKDNWDHDADHDGSNTLGWRVYVNEWGQVNGFDVICVVKPAYVWHGK